MEAEEAVFEAMEVMESLNNLNKKKKNISPFVKNLDGSTYGSSGLKRFLQSDVSRAGDAAALFTLASGLATGLAFETPLAPVVNAVLSFSIFSVVAHFGQVRDIKKASLDGFWTVQNKDKKELSLPEKKLNKLAQDMWDSTFWGAASAGVLTGVVGLSFGINLGDAMAAMGVVALVSKKRISDLEKGRVIVKDFKPKIS